MNIKKIEIKKYWLILAFFIMISGMLFGNMLMNKNNNQEYISQGIFFDDRDSKVYVGMYNNIFTGIVLKKYESEYIEKPFSAWTDFEVEVVENLKGDLKGKNIVRQYGGIYPEGIMKMEGNDLIEEGNLYLFSTRNIGKIYNKNNRLINYQSSNPNSLVLISKNIKLKDKNKAIELTKRNKRFLELLKAYRGEVQDRGDVKYGQVKNSYLDLSQKKKDEIDKKIEDMEKNIKKTSHNISENKK